MFSESLQDLPDVQELITQVRSEKCSLQAAAILGEPPASPDVPSLLFLFSPTHVTLFRLKGVVLVNLYEFYLSLPLPLPHSHIQLRRRI